MDVGTQFFQPFFLLHAKMLLFVDDKQAKIAKAYRFGKQRMGADDNINLAIFQGFLGLLGVFGGHKAGELADLDGQTGKTL